MNIKLFDAAIIVAGGKGERLSDVVGMYRKPLASIHGKPIILNTVEMLSGICNSLFIVGNPQNSDEINSELNKTGWNDIPVICQTEPLGMAHAVKLGIDEIHNSGSVIIVCCDNLFPKQDVISLYNSIQSGSHMSWIYHDNTIDARRFAVLEIINGHKVLIQKPRYPQGTKCWCGPVAFVEIDELKSVLLNIQKSTQTNEYDFVDVMNEFITSSFTQAVKGFSYFFDIGTPESYLKALEFFKEK